MKRHAKLLWLTALFLGWCLDFLFWRQNLGLNFPVYVVLSLAVGLVLLHLDGKRIAPGASALLPLILFFAGMSFLRAEPLTVGMSVILTLLLMALLAVNFVDGDWIRHTLLDHAIGFLRLALSTLVRPLLFNSDIQKERAQSGLPVARSSLWPAARGILIAIPVLLVFGALLASADLVFGKELQNLFELLRLENLPQYIFRLIYILVGAYALVGVYLHASGYGRTRLPGTEPALPSLRFLGFVEAAILLSSVIILFSAFVVVQFRYFFGGQTNIGVEGFTYSEYARRGFGELLIVAFFSLVLLLGLSAITRRETALQRDVFSVFGVAISALVTVMLFSAYQRLALYEAAYGFSRLRTYSHVFLVWIGLLLAAVAVLEVLRRERYFAAAALIAALGFGACLGFLNVDAFIARQNVARAASGGALDTAYLASLSTDSVGPLAEIYRSASTSEPIRRATGAVLACRLHLASPEGAVDWRSFNLSRSQAASWLATLQPGLQPYRFVDDGWPAHVITPDGSSVYDCQGSGAD